VVAVVDGCGCASVGDGVGVRGVVAGGYVTYDDGGGDIYNVDVVVSDGCSVSGVVGVG